MRDLLWIVGFVAVLAGLYYVAFRIDPHWVSKDGHRFVCHGQLVDRYGNTLQTWREFRFEVIDHKRMFARRRSRWTRRNEGVWRVAAKSDNPPKNREVYLLASADSDNTDQMAIRVPASSRAVEILEGLRAQ
ncbi:MAG TPA: hypothetical protein VFV63_19630 [Ilumatobacteraceae bacterium]|nr:hypothetical protein [Ilumatobacteraceae bacterium]